VNPDLVNKSSWINHPENFMISLHIYFWEKKWYSCWFNYFDKFAISYQLSTVNRRLTDKDKKEKKIAIE
jgi:hypothetical protein